MLSIHHKKAIKERGAAHLFLVFIFVFGLLGLLGFLGYNTWQKQQADAGGVASLGRKVKTIQSKLLKQNKELKENQATYLKHKTVTLGIGSWLDKKDLGELPPPTDAQELKYYNTAMAIKGAQKEFWKKFNEDKVTNPDLLTAYKQRAAARKPLQDARALRDKAVLELAALIEQDKDGKNDSASAAIDAARERKQQAQKKVDRLKVAYGKESEAFLALVANWTEYTGLQSARQELEAAWDKRIEARDTIVERKKAIRDLKVELEKARKALKEAKKKQKEQQTNQQHNNNNANTGSGDTTPGPVCPSGSSPNSTHTACQRSYPAEYDLVYKCPPNSTSISSKKCRGNVPAPGVGYPILDKIATKKYWCRGDDTRIGQTCFEITKYL